MANSFLFVLPNQTVLKWWPCTFATKCWWNIKKSKSEWILKWRIGYNYCFIDFSKTWWQNWKTRRTFSNSNYNNSSCAFIYNNLFTKLITDFWDLYNNKILGFDFSKSYIYGQNSSSHSFTKHCRKCSQVIFYNRLLLVKTW